MTKARANGDRQLEEFLAELTAVAYRVSLQYGVRGSFLDLELDLWRELRAVFHRQLLAFDLPSSVSNHIEGRQRPGHKALPAPLDFIGAVS